MATEVKFRRGTTAEREAFTGVLAEMGVDTDRKVVTVFDGSAAAGFPGKQGSLLEAIKTNDYTIVAADCGEIRIANKASAITFNLDPAATLGKGFVVWIKNIGTGILTIDPDGAETIDNPTLAQNEITVIWTDGSNWRSLGALAVGGGGGIVLQDKETEDTTNRSTTSTTYVSTSISIVLPNNLKDTGSRVRIRMHGIVGFADNNQSVLLTLHDGTSTLHPGGVEGLAGYRSETNANLDGIGVLAFEFIHSPASVTPKTYTLQWKTSTSTANLGNNKDSEIDLPTYLHAEELD